MPRRTRIQHRPAASPRPRADRPSTPTVFVVGAGRMGTALALGLRAAGWKVLGLWTRSQGHRPIPGLVLHSGALPSELTRARLVLLTVPDREVAAVSARLAGDRLVRPGQIFAHAAGALDLSPLGALAEAGAEVGSLHPMLAATRGKVRLRGGSCAIDGSAPALRLLHKAALALGLTPLEIPSGGRARYHAAATLVATATIAATAAGVKLLSSLGVEPEAAQEALASLAASSLRGLAQTGLPGALTGPVARGDAEVVRAHLAALRGTPERELYLAVARAAIPLARAQGTDAAALDRIEKALQER